METMQAKIGFSRQMARKCFKSLSLTTPVPIEDILKQHFQFQIVHLEDISSNISAMVDLDSKYIGINQDHSVHHQRFTLAHELGHFYLNHKKRNFTEYLDKMNSSHDPVETEANEFAAELLVPMVEIKKLAKTGMKLDELSKHFWVSQHVITIQFMKHNII